MRPKDHSFLELTALTVVSLLPRLAGTLWLPNAFGDAYAYTEQIYYMRRALLAGTFSLANLFGFWLPLYQLICAGLSALVGSPFYVPKVISALTGAGVCLLVFLLTLDLTANRFWSFVCFALVAVNPYHVLYSSSALTDVPHAFVVLLCAYCCIRDRWLLAALCGLVAGLIRIESWTLVTLIPLLQVMRARRISPVACMVLLFGPIFWFYVSWKAGGSPWRYFEIRNDYIVETLTASPWLASFAPWRVAWDLLRLLYTSNPLVLLACLGSLAFGLRRCRCGHLIVLEASSPARPSGPKLRTRERKTAEVVGQVLANPKIRAATILLTFFLANLAFLLLAYFTRNQPEIWPRYGLIFLVLGLPLLAGYQLRHKTNGPSPYRSRSNQWRRAHSIFATLFALQFCIQLIDVTRLTVKSDPNLTVANFLEEQHFADRSIRFYCEDGAIRVLSGVPLEEFKDQYNSPPDRQSFLRSLRENQIRMLVYKELPGSRLGEIIQQIRSTRSSGITLEEVTARPRQKSGETIVLYRVHYSEVATKTGDHR